MLPAPIYILSGTVTDGKDPFSDVTITYGGGNTATDGDGQYHISANSGVTITILEVTLSGYTVNEDLPMGFVMTEDKEQDFTMKADEEARSAVPYIATAIILLIAVLLIALILFFRRSYEVVKGEAVIGDDRAPRKKDYVFSLEGEPSGMVVYRIGEDGDWITPTLNEEGSYVIPKEEVIGKLTIEQH
jgi:hypothetical protein